MNRRALLGSIASSVGVAMLPGLAQTQSRASTAWWRPAVDPYTGNDDLALQLFRGYIDEPYGVYIDFRNFVMNSPGKSEVLIVPRAVGKVEFGSMTFSARQTVPNIYVTQAMLDGPGWRGKSRAMTTWTKSYWVGRDELIVTYTKFEVCQNRAIAIGFVQGNCIWNPALCGPGCDDLRRRISS